MGISTVMKPSELNYISFKACMIYAAMFETPPYNMRITMRDRRYYGSVYGSRELYIGDTQDDVEAWLLLWEYV